MTKARDTDAAPGLDERAVAALTDDTVSSAALAALVEETAAAIAAAESTAAAEKERAFDLALDHDAAKAAHAAMVDASFRADRLKVLAPRLRARWGETLRREEADAWKRERDEFEATVLPGILPARASYETALQAILNFFTQVSDFNAARGELLARRPLHLGLESVAEPPIPAASKLLADTRLFDLENGAQVWPGPQQTNRLAVEMSQSVLAMAASQDPDECTPNWWKAAARRQAAHRVETERQDARLRQLEQEQTERVNREERERWAAAHGGVR